MMEASAAGGTAVAIVVGIFEPGAVVELYHVESAYVLRAEGGERVGRRAANDEGIVGFDGLVDGDHYFATGYTSGRYEERRLVAHQPDEAADQIQPAPQSAPTTLGVEQTPIEDVPSAEVATTELPEPVEGEPPIEVGLPEGVTSPVLEPPAPDTADSSTSPDAAGPAQTTEDVAPVTVEDSTSTAPTSTETAIAGTDASTSAGGTDAVPQTDAPAADAAAVDPSAPVAAEDQVAAEAPAPEAAAPAEAPAAAPAEAPQDQLVKQAEGLGVQGTESLSEDELRQAITAAGQTPVA